VTVSGQDTLIWLTHDEAISLNLVALSERATARALYHEQEKVEKLKSDLNYAKQALHFSEEINERSVREIQNLEKQIVEYVSALESLQKKLKKALRAAGFYKAWAISSTVVAVVLVVILIL